MNTALLSLAIFAITYLAIATERVHRTLAALLGAAAMVVFGILDDRKAVEAIDFHTLGLLVGMMIIVGILRKTGVFQWLAIKTVKRFHGSPWKIMAGFFLLTAVASALLDNVTTVLLMVPITLLISEALAVDPIPFVISEILASNIGGTATLIGDPPNIMIGSASGLSFLDFIIHLTPFIAVLTVPACAAMVLVYRKSLRPAADSQQIADQLKEEGLITDPGLLRKSLIIFALVVIGFLWHGHLGWQASTVALLGAFVLILIGGQDPHEIFEAIEWPTIFFLVGLFVVVGGVHHAGALDWFAQKLVAWTDGNLIAANLIMLWVSAVFAAVAGNIGSVAALIPVVIAVAGALFPELPREQLLLHPQIVPVWWSLALGGCLGGNGSLVGAPANVVASGVVEKAGHPISFGRYLKVGVPFTLLTLVLASVYVVVRYLM